MQVLREAGATIQRKKLIGALMGAVILTLASCEAPTQIGVPKEAVDRFGHMKEDQILPKIGPKTFINAFGRYCAPYIGSPARTKAALLRNGYSKLAIINGEATAYAHPDGKPLIAIGKSSETKSICMVISKDNAALRPVAKNYLTRKYGSNLMDISKLLPTKNGTVSQAWLTEKTQKNIMYLAFTMQDKKLGKIYTFSVGEMKK